MGDRVAVFDLIAAERDHQRAKWGAQDHVNYKWMTIALEELGEVSAAILGGDLPQVVVELIQCAAVIVAWLELAVDNSGLMDEVRQRLACRYGGKAE